MNKIIMNKIKNINNDFNQKLINIMAEYNNKRVEIVKQYNNKKINNRMIEDIKIIKLRDQIL